MTANAFPSLFGCTMPSLSTAQASWLLLFAATTVVLLLSNYPGVLQPLNSLQAELSLSQLN